MAEPFKSKHSRIVFSDDKQQVFLAEVKRKTGKNEAELASLVGVHRRTLNDWARGEYSMPWSAVKTLCKKSGVLLPSSVEVKDRYWYTSLGAKEGWRVVKERYGRIPIDDDYRKEKWLEWWNSEGKYKPHRVVGVSKTIKRPRLSARLAEFVGIMIGDGSMTKYQVVVTLDGIRDKEYAEYVADLTEGLFDVPVVMHRYSAEQKNRRVVALVVSRVQLVRYCHDFLGLKIGHKLRQGLDVPDWIRKKQSYCIACLRGLMDTDGSIFNECHNIKGKRYCYPRLSFSSASKPLCGSAMEIMHELGFSPSIRSGRKVQLEKRDEIIEYFRIVGTNNLKHRKRYKSFLGGVG